MVSGHCRKQSADTFPELFFADAEQNCACWLVSSDHSKVLKSLTATLQCNYTHKNAHIQFPHPFTTGPFPSLCLSQSRRKQQPSYVPVSTSVTLTGGPAGTSCFGFTGQGLNTRSCFGFGLSYTVFLETKTQLRLYYYRVVSFIGSFEMVYLLKSFWHACRK